MTAGGLMAACFAIMVLVTLYQIWVSSTPKMVAERVGGDTPTVG
jgi:hypothetical protein